MHKYGSRASLPNSHTQHSFGQVWAFWFSTENTSTSPKCRWCVEEPASRKRPRKRSKRSVTRWDYVEKFFLRLSSYFLSGSLFYSRFALEQKEVSERVCSQRGFMLSAWLSSLASWVYGFSLRSECQRFSLRWTEDSENVSIQNRSSQLHSDLWAKAQWWARASNLSLRVSGTGDCSLSPPRTQQRSGRTDLVRRSGRVKRKSLGKAFIYDTIF